MPLLPRLLSMSACMYLYVVGRTLFPENPRCNASGSIVQTKQSFRSNLFHRFACTSPFRTNSNKSRQSEQKRTTLVKKMVDPNYATSLESIRASSGKLWTKNGQKCALSHYHRVRCRQSVRRSQNKLSFHHLCSAVKSRGACWGAGRGKHKIRRERERERERTNDDDRAMWKGARNSCNRRGNRLEGFGVLLQPRSSGCGIMQRGAKPMHLEPTARIYQKKWRC